MLGTLHDQVKSLIEFATTTTTITKISTTMMPKTTQSNYDHRKSCRNLKEKDEAEAEAENY